MRALSIFFRLIKETFTEWNLAGGPRLAASLSFYTAFSIAPLLVVLITVLGFFISTAELQKEIIRQIEVNISAEAGSIINDLIISSSQPEQSLFASVLSVGALIIGALAVFENLQASLDIIWNVYEERRDSWKDFLLNKLLSFGMILVVGFLLLISLAISTMIAFFDSYFAKLVPVEGTILQVVNFLISFSLVTLLFMLIYKFLPHAHVQWRDVTIGAIITALLFTIGKSALAWYLANSAVATSYGAAGTFAVILLWVYYSAQIVLFGAEFTQVFAKYYGSKITARRRREIERENQSEQMA